MTRSTHHPAYTVFLKLLVAERKALGVTQVGLGEWLGNRQTFVSKIENGERRLDVVEMLEYLEGIGSNPVDFISQLTRKLDALPARKDRKLAIRKRRADSLKRRKKNL